jgi:glucose/arabinose dehydrogenase
MKRLLLLIVSLFLVACLPETPPPPTPVPATVTLELEEPPTVAPPTEEPATALPPTDAPTSPPPDATTFPNLDNYIWETVVSGLERPVDIQHAGDERLFIIEKVGRIRILQNGQLIDFPYLNITDRVGSGGNEQGLLGLAFHPNYAENGLFFVNYTDKSGDTVIARYRVTADPNIGDPSSEVILLQASQPFGNHNGGGLDFGPDGYLYIALGDGGSAGDPQNNGQKLDTFLGKILRLNVDSTEPYAIPDDNPFGNEIWAYGLRNPWRISFDSTTGNLYIGDVGQGQWEEINFVQAGTPGGLNFGWKYFEGSYGYDGAPPQDVQFEPPVAEYDHGQGCSVTGGYVYRGAMPEWNGIYLYGDYCTGTVWGLIRSDEGWQNQALFGAVGNITSFGQDNLGEVYIATDSGSILRLEAR